MGALSWRSQNSLAILTGRIHNTMLPTRQWLSIYVLSFACWLLISGCGTSRDAHKYQLTDDVYLYRQKGERYQKAWVYIKNDTISILSYQHPDLVLQPKTNVDQLFLKRTFDVDVMTVAFKYRPATTNLPRQLTTDFNGNVFVGYRLDRFKVSFTRTPLGTSTKYRHRGITAGVFGGIGATSVTSSTTNNHTNDEYTGFVLSRGAALMIGLNNLTVGFGVGWDYITDRDKAVWIYQNKAWYGLTVGLNLN